MARPEEAPSPAPPEALAQELERLRAEHERLRLEHEHVLAAQELIDKAHSDFAEAYYFAPVPLVTVDRTGGIRHVNRAGAKLLGQGGAHLLGRSMRPFITRADRRRLEHHLACARAARHPPCERRCRRV